MKLYIFPAAVLVFPFLNALCDAHFGHLCYLRTKVVLGTDLWHWAKRLWWNGLWLLSFLPGSAVPDFVWYWQAAYCVGLGAVGCLSWDLGAHLGGRPEWGCLKLKRNEPGVGRRIDLTSARVLAYL